MSVLRILDLVTDKDAAAGVVPGLERAIPSQGRRVRLAAAPTRGGLHGQSLSPAGPRMLLQIEPTAKERFPQRRLARETRQEEAAEPGTTAPAGEAAAASPGSPSGSRKKTGGKAEPFLPHRRPTPRSPRPRRPARRQKNRRRRDSPNANRGRIGVRQNPPRLRGEVYAVMLSSSCVSVLSVLHARVPLGWAGGWPLGLLLAAALCGGTGARRATAEPSPPPPIPTFPGGPGRTARALGAPALGARRRDRREAPGSVAAGPCPL